MELFDSETGEKISKPYLCVTDGRRELAYLNLSTYRGRVQEARSENLIKPNDNCGYLVRLMGSINGKRKLCSMNNSGVSYINLEVMKKKFPKTLEKIEGMESINGKTLN